jgi:hypothetical protein
MPENKVMGRNWVPKWPVKCKCGWRGIRAAVFKPCPRCGFWCPKKVRGKGKNAGE